MYYRLYSYTITQNNNIPVGPDRHYDLFVKSKGKDEYGALADYRGRKNSILMHLQKYQSDFSGLIGKYSTERQVTKYDDMEDIADTITVDDEDYPNTAFIAYPRLGFIAVLDSGQLNADGAISRLHNIIGHRTKCYFVAEAVTQPIDIRKAVKRFRVTEVTFEIFPVNPHTGDLGKKLDEDRARDHIKKIYGKLDGSEASPLELNGGLAYLPWWFILTTALPVGLYRLFCDGVLAVVDDGNAIGALAAIAVIGAFLGSVSISAMTQIQKMVCEYPFSDYLKEEKLFDIYLFWPQFTLMLQLSLIIFSGLSSYIFFIGFGSSLRDDILLLNATYMIYVVTKTWGLIDMIRTLSWHYEGYTRLLAEHRPKQ